MLDRETGEPLFPVEERPAPASDVPGERAWPTQPIPTAPPPLVPQRLSEADLYAPSAEHLAACESDWRELRNDGLFTPPSLRGSIALPVHGWRRELVGRDFDPAHGAARGARCRISRTSSARGGWRARDRGGSDVQPAHGTSLRTLWWLLTGRGTGERYRLSPLGGRIVFENDDMPCNAPPWGRLVAVDLASGEIAWSVSTSTRRRDPGSEGYGPALSTASGLVFHGGTREPVLRVHDVATGDASPLRLPAGLHAGPISYKLAPGDKQFVVVAPGGHVGIGSPIGDS